MFVEQDRFKHRMDQAFHHNALINDHRIRCYLESYLAIFEIKSGMPNGHLTHRNIDEISWTH